MRRGPAHRSSSPDGRGVLGAGAGAGQLGVAGGLGLCAAGSDAVLDDGDVVGQSDLVCLSVAALQHLGWRLRGYRFGFGVDVCGAGRRRGEHPSGSCDRVECVGATGAPVESAQTAVVSSAPVPVPVNSVLPVVSGSAQQGQTLSSTTGTW